MPVRFEPDPSRFRQVLGHFCTGVTIITDCDEGGPAGFACQSFAAVSLDPPLVLFCPSRSSATWPRIERAGHFCANVLAAEQRGAGQDASGTQPGRTSSRGVRWSPSPSGAPVLDGALTWAGCTVEAVHEAGDHFVVLGRVTELGAMPRRGQPLLFYRGRYAVTPPRSPRRPARGRRHPARLAPARRLDVKKLPAGDGLAVFQAHA